MSDNSKKYTAFTISPALSGSTATTIFGADFWKTPNPPVEVPAPDHPIYAYVGRIASDWAHVEHTLDLIIWELAGIDPAMGACITAQMNGVYSRCKAIIAQLKLWEKGTDTSLASLINATTDIMNKQSQPGDKRNRVVHYPWYVYTGTQKTAQFKAMPHKDYRYGLHQVDKEELEQALESIQKFSERTTNTNPHKE